MNTSKLHARLPALADPEVFSDPCRSIMTAEGNALLTYDPATQSGFIYCIDSGVWFIHAPADFLQFAIFARMGGHTIKEGPESERWMQACRGGSVAASAADGPQETRH